MSKSSDLSGSGGGTKSTGGGGGGGKGFYNPTTSETDNTDLPKADRFSNIKSVSWAEEAILSLAEKGVISGRADGIFAPNDNMTREEFVKLVVLAFELSAEGESNFADVEYDKWYAPFINAAVSNGVVKGLSDREFGVGRNITRQDAAVIIARAAKSVSDEGAAEKFNDASDIAFYAKGAVGALTSVGAINGDGNGAFLPNNSITRAEAVKIVYSITKLQDEKGI